MLRRGFREAQEATVVERRHALILRQLSNFLADATVALDATESLGEVLQLVAEQARELTHAGCSIAQLDADAGFPAIEAVSHADDSPATTDVSEFSARLGPQEPSMRRGRWLGAALNGWDGARLGSIHLFDRADGDFSEADEAVVVHLAQMATTAVERARRS
jgi:hypothetical protein